MHIPTTQLKDGVVFAVIIITFAHIRSSYYIVHTTIIILQKEAICEYKFYSNYNTILKESLKLLEKKKETNWTLFLKQT